MSERENKSESQNIYHLIILDSSSSMGSVRNETISGLNEQLQSIKKASIDFKAQIQKVCFVTFDSEVKIGQIWNKSVEEIPDFNKETYCPDGCTALLDGIGMGVTKLKNEISKELLERKATVVVTIFTDGEENSSREFNREQVKTLLQEVQDSGQWTVAFLGCGSDVLNVAESLNISRANTMEYSVGSAGTNQAFTIMANARYARSCAYNSCDSLESMTQVNKTVGFFDNLDLDFDDDTQNIGEVESDGDIE
jgi:uncharacterized protein YegL